MITGIADIYAGDGEWEFDVAARAGVVAVIHKATEGRTYTDRGLPHAMRCAAMMRMLRGCYHYGRSGNVPAQVEHFLATVAAALGPQTWEQGDVILCLDLEGRIDDADHNGEIDDPTTMTTEEAASFVTLVHQRTGRWPCLYAGKSKLKERMRRASADTRAVLGNCPLWLAKYGERPEAPAPWARWALWQYSDGKPADGPADQHTFPRSTPGFHRCDRSAFDGTVEELAAWWSSAGA